MRRTEPKVHANSEGEKKHCRISGMRVNSAAAAASTGEKTKFTKCTHKLWRHNSSASRTQLKGKPWHYVTRRIDERTIHDSANRSNVRCTATTQTINAQTAIFQKGNYISHDLLMTNSFRAYKRCTAAAAARPYHNHLDSSDSTEWQRLELLNIY